VVFLASGSLDPKEVPSSAFDQACARLSTERLSQPETTIGRDDLLGKVWLLSVGILVWPAEHLVAELALRARPCLNYKDERMDGLRCSPIMVIPMSRRCMTSMGASVDCVYGVPETFLIGLQRVA
jgi:cytochrome c biogenesis protein CcmG/thiol:disulfide interchange protein DsbE